MSLEKELLKRRLYEKLASIKLKKLTAAFALADPKSAKKTHNLTVFFALSGSV